MRCDTHDELCVEFTPLEYDAVMDGPDLKMDERPIIDASSFDEPETIAVVALAGSPSPISSSFRSG